MGHSYMQTVLLMYLWTALFAGGLVGLSQLHISLFWLALLTLVMVVALLLATMPRLRPWNGKPALNGGKASGPGHAKPSRRERLHEGASPIRSGD